MGADLVGQPRVAPSGPLPSSEVHPRDAQPFRDFSVLTAASESELQNVASRPGGGGNVGAQAYSSAPTTDTADFTLFIQQLYLYAVSGTIFLVMLAIFYIVQGQAPHAVGNTLLALAAGVTGIIGCKRRDWRFLLGFFITSFILLIYMATNAVLSLVIVVAWPWMPNQSGTDPLSGWIIAEGVLRILLYGAFAIFWGFAAFYAERTVRLLLEKVTTTRARFRTGPPLHAVIVGHATPYPPPTTAASNIPSKVVDPPSQEPTERDGVDLNYFHRQPETYQQQRPPGGSPPA